VVEAKSLNAANGIETSSFTVCTRIRPMFEPEHAENYVAVVPGRVSGSDTEHTEQALVFTPKLSIRGDPKIEKADFQFDYCFGPELPMLPSMARSAHHSPQEQWLGKLGWHLHMDRRARARHTL